jgi:c-di-AMP phosphodiesterase-like protein
MRMVYSTDFLNSIIDNLPLGIIVFDNNANVVRYNKSLLSYFELDDLTEPESKTKLFVEALVSNSVLNEMLIKAQQGAVIQNHGTALITLVATAIFRLIFLELKLINYNIL